MASERRQTRRGALIASILFAVLAVAFAVAAIILARDEDEADAVPTPPPALAGRNEMIHVFNALEQQGLMTEFAQGGVPPGTLSTPGQKLTVDGVPLYVFVYDDVEVAAAEAASADPAEVLPERSPSGTPVAMETPRVFSESNITVALVGGSDEIAERVEQAIASLP